MKPGGVSVVVPVYNSKATIGECVRSLLNVDYPADLLELIFVDNGSSDDSLSILESFGDRVRILHESKRGAAAARNRGIREARFPIVALTDSDCRVDRNWLPPLVAGLADPEVGICGGAIRAWNPSDRMEVFGETIHDNGMSIHVYKPPSTASGNWASRRDVLIELGGFDEAFLRGEDSELSCRVHQAGLKMVYAPESIVYHRNENTLGGLFREGFHHGFHAIPLLEKHRELFLSFGYRPRYMGPYVQLWEHFKEYCSGSNPESSDCKLVFHAGKRLGRLAGSIKHEVLYL
jgi:glycosyltransferase involved in cell wall biosynthesis